MIGSELAKRLDAGLGDSVVFRKDSESQGNSLKISGIYSTGIGAFDGNMGFCPVGVLPLQDQNTTVAVFLDPGIDPNQVLPVLRKNLPDSTLLKPWWELMPD